MKVKLQFFRVYGSKFQYASNSRFITSNDPVKFKFPFENVDSVIVLGKPCKSVFEASDITLANAMHMINSYENFDLERELTPNELDIAIKKELTEIKKNPKTYDCNFYLTIIIEKEIDVPEEHFVDSEYFWLDYQEALKLENEFRDYASINIDFIASVISVYISNWFFQEIIINSVFFSKRGKKKFGIPVFGMGTKSKVILNDYELENLVKFLGKIDSIPENLVELLDIVTHYKFATLREKDPWKQFIFNFLALEILVNEISALVYEKVINNDCWNSFIKPVDIHENEWKKRNKKKRSLRANFIIVSFVLSPETFLNDYSTFMEAKSVRNDISHGEIRLNHLKLPISELDELLNQYLTYIIESHENLFNNMDKNKK